MGVTVSSPSASTLNQGADQNIIWSLDPANPAAKFNLSLCTPSPEVGRAPVCRSIKTNVSLTAAPHVWKVSKLLTGSSYKIEVCPVDRSGCAYSAEFNILPPLLKNQQEVLKLFKDAMGNRYANLNSNAKSGAQGVYDYIIAAPDAVPPKLPNITKEMVNVSAPPVYIRTPILQLDWFKSEFLKNTGNVLETKDKAGIKYAMSRRYFDLCAAGWNTAIKNATGVYNTAVANAERARKGVRAIVGTGTAANPQFPATANSEELCNFNYYRDLNNMVIVPARNGDYDNAARRFVAIEGLNNVKNTCINATYTTFYVVKKTVLSAFTAAKTTADGLYNTCVDNRISAWGTW